MPLDLPLFSEPPAGTPKPLSLAPPAPFIARSASMRLMLLDTSVLLTADSMEGDPSYSPATSRNTLVLLAAGSKPHAVLSAPLAATPKPHAVSLMEDTLAAPPVPLHPRRSKPYHHPSPLTSSAESDRTVREPRSFTSRPSMSLLLAPAPSKLARVELLEEQQVHWRLVSLHMLQLEAQILRDAWFTTRLTPESRHRRTGEHAVSLKSYFELRDFWEQVHNDAIIPNFPELHATIPSPAHQKMVMPLLFNLAISALGLTRVISEDATPQLNAAHGLAGTVQSHLVRLGRMHHRVYVPEHDDMWEQQRSARVHENFHAGSQDLSVGKVNARLFRVMGGAILMVTRRSLVDQIPHDVDPDVYDNAVATVDRVCDVLARLWEFVSANMLLGVKLDHSFRIVYRLDPPTLDNFVLDHDVTINNWDEDKRLRDQFRDHAVVETPASPKARNRALGIGRVNESSSSDEEEARVRLKMALAPKTAAKATNITTKIKGPPKRWW